MKPEKKDTSEKQAAGGGFGLIEVIIATAIMTILMAGIASSIIFNTRGAHSVNQNLVFDELISDIRQVLDNPLLCKNSFTGANAQNVVNGGPVVIHFGNQTIDDGVNSNFQNGSLKIINLKFSNLNTTVPGVTVADINLEADLRGTGTLAIVGGDTKKATFTQTFSTTGAAINNCDTSANLSYTIKKLNPFNQTVITVLCTNNPGDIATGGGVRVAAWRKAVSVPNVPVPGGPANGWQCIGEFGNSIAECWAVCRSP